MTSRIPIERLFVYGTLMPGCCNHRWIEGSVHSACSGRIRGILVDLGAYPALVSGDGIVEGVVLEIDAPAVVFLDHVEGYVPRRDDCLYSRKEVTVELDDGKETNAWTYQFAHPQRLRDHPRVALKIVDGICVYAWSSKT